ARADAVEPGKAALLALGQETAVPGPGEEGEARRRFRRLRNGIGGHVPGAVVRHQVAGRDAAGHLLEEGKRYVGKLRLYPLMRGRVQVLVPPQRGKADAVGKAGPAADDVVALVVRQ